MKDLIKKDGKYLLTWLILLILTLLLVTVSQCYETNKLVNLVTDNFGKISLLLVVAFGVLYFFVLRNIDKKEKDLSKVFLQIVIPIGILYCIFNPLGKVPDERSHVFRAYEISQRTFIFSSRRRGKCGEKF